MTRLTEAQLAVVASTADRLLVHAGAGSGKTTTVVQALCHNLGVPVVLDGVAIPGVERPLTFDQVAAITFTNQAAADLKRKLRGALRAGGRPDLAAEVDSARIGTIHGFCGDLLREFALRAGTPPGRRVLEEGESAALVDDCARDVLRGAIEARDVPGLEGLLSGRKLRDVTRWVAHASEDTDRLAASAADAEALRDHERALVTLAQRAAALRSQRLDREGVLDFDRMIIATRGLLENAVVRYAVQQRVRLLVLDEFQDVDPAQRDIAYLLSGVGRDDVHPTRVVLVGDPKQSIYRFRRADITSWTTVARDFASGAGAVLPLGENFRSKAAILGLVDATVGGVMAQPVAADGARRPFEVEYAALDARAEWAAGDRAVELLVVPAATGGKARLADEVRNMEAAAVARRIVALHESGTRFGDVAILLTGWRDVRKYESELRSAGIPSYVLRSEGFWQAREVLDCVLALRAIRDPRDDVALTGFLKSPFVGVRDDTLLALAREAGQAGLAAALGRVDRERALLDRAGDLLAGLGAVRDRVSVHGLLRRLLYETAYLASAALDGNEGQQRVANVRKLVRIAAGNPDQSLGEFLRDIAEQRARDDRVAPERLYGERGDVVTITSVHSAKGLEWPTVFWCDLVREVRPENDRYLVGRDTLSVKLEAVDAGDADGGDARHAALADALALEQRAEAYRLWYVASTRARERLVLSGIPLGALRGSGVSPARMLRDAFPTLDAGVDVEYTSLAGTRYHAVVVPCDGVTAPAPLPRSPAPEFALPPLRVTPPVGGLRLSATQLMAFAHDPASWWTRYVLRFDGAGPAGMSRMGASAIATGLIVHEVLERLETEGLDLGELIEDAIASHDGDAPIAASALGLAYRSYVRARIDAATASPVWQEVAGAASARRELPFTRLLAGGTAITGAIDLAARDGMVARVVDVKTSAAGATVLAERYDIQAAVYADAVRAIAGAGQVSFTLLAVPAGVAVDVVPTGDVETLVARLRAYAGSGGAPATV
jgi:ATP-dependent helicase/nuclease subunit A